MKTELTIEQSQRLIELGVAPNKASKVKEFDDPVSKWTHRGTPIFIIADLLGILPKVLRKDDKAYDYSLTMYWNKTSYMWRVTYDAATDCLGACDASELINALYGLIVFCIGNKYIEL